MINFLVASVANNPLIGFAVNEDLIETDRPWALIFFFVVILRNAYANPGFMLKTIYEKKLKLTVSLNYNTEALNYSRITIFVIRLLMAAVVKGGKTYKGGI